MDGADFLKRRLLVAPLLLVLAAAVAVAPAQAAPNPLRHDLDRVNSRLRTAVETAPGELSESLVGAEGVCAAAERAAARQEDESAAADWTTLDQLVGEVAEVDQRRVVSAFARADSTLVALHGRFESTWEGGSPQSRELQRGVGDTRRGIAVVRAAVSGLETPFRSWRARRCTDATSGIDVAFAQIGAGLTRINAGMLRLWRLAGLP